MIERGGGARFLQEAEGIGVGPIEAVARRMNYVPYDVRYPPSRAGPAGTPSGRRCGPDAPPIQGSRIF